ncbi:MAG TPA: DtxR family transcriptional regulator [Deltaproteobacteria bacterium]|nr:DtxR family transcriptional regulator [Deltaproteobacteria bacterium]
MIDKERVDEALQLLWILDEDGASTVAAFEERSHDAEPGEVLDHVVRSGLARRDGDGLSLTDEGRAEARGLIRRHRLSERLFSEVFDIRDPVAHEDACKLEHILSEELTDSVCTFLAHPDTCQHGKPIPRGECCKKYTVEMTPLVVRLSDFEVGARCKIVFIASTDTGRFKKLNSIGILAGSVIKLLRKKPTVVLQVDETTVAIDPDMAAEIYVRKA